MTGHAESHDARFDDGQGAPVPEIAPVEAGPVLAGAAVAERLLENVETVVVGKTEVVRLVLAAFACGGHVLLEDVPGTAKTVLARALAASIEGGVASRIQCTPDLQPSDVTGVNIYDQKLRDFEFSFDVHLVIDIGSHAVLLGLPVLTDENKDGQEDRFE